MPEFRFERRSGRVISLARMLLASLFLFAVWIDPTQPSTHPEFTYLVLAAYAVIAATIAATTWNSWWLDAKLAAPAHVLDVAMFTMLVFSTAGYTSPFFVFFVFVLLAAAIRWGWRETALTAGALIILYLSAGLTVALSSTEEFELQRFIVRLGQLIILSAILIWFGVHQSRSAGIIQPDDPGQANLDGLPFADALLFAVRVSGAERALLSWQSSENEQLIALHDGYLQTIEQSRAPLKPAGIGRVFLYDLQSDRALIHREGRQPDTASASELLDRATAREIGLKGGLSVPVILESGNGQLFLESISGLSTDHLEFGSEIGRNVGSQIQRNALLLAVEEAGESRARLSMARDLHDSVVQFLAGAAFRIEAMIRKAGNGDSTATGLAELKRLMLEEQDDLRTYIGALKSDREISLDRAARELETLADKLASQWQIDCGFSADVPLSVVPTRLHLDAQQLVREAVANAVRHGKAGCVDIRMEADDQFIRLEIVDNGIGFQVAPGDPDGIRPRSLTERVSDAGGKVTLASDSSGTSVTIQLPLRGLRQWPPSSSPTITQ